MINIEQLIYNKLSLQEGVNLPEFGSLRVERRAAKFVSKSAVQAPYAQVVFSRRNAPRLVDILELMMDNSALTRQECERQYKRWLELAIDQDVIVIEGVGSIKSDFFTPSPELERMLNPFGGEVVSQQWGGGSSARTTASITLTPKTKRVLCWSAAGVALGAVAAFAVANIDFASLAQKSSEPAAVVENVTPAQTVPVDTVAVVEDSAAMRRPSSDVLSSTVSTTSYPFHVIAGMYSNDENADKFIASMRSKLSDTIVYEKIKRSSGKILVSIYASTTEDDAEAAAKKFGANYWVFKRDK